MRETIARPVDDPELQSNCQIRFEYLTWGLKEEEDDDDKTRGDVQLMCSG